MFKVIFHNQNKVYELFCRKVEGSEMAYGFVELVDLIFEGDDGLVIDPTEERLRAEFADVERIHLPMHAVIRVEQVRKRGACAIRDAKSGEKVTPLPLDGPRRGR
ncbi:MAG: DUF1820 family protein [Wenzhouxiangella sp.]